MSDYGFKTLDNRSEVLNAKYPIFGYDLSHSVSTFKKVIITDKTTPEPEMPDFSWASMPTYTYKSPQFGVTARGAEDWSTMPDYSLYKEDLIYTYKHGYNFKPIVYSKVSCNLRARTKIMVSRSNAAAWGEYAGRTLGNFTKTYTASELFSEFCAPCPNMISMASYTMGEVLDESFFGKYDDFDVYYNTIYGTFSLLMPTQLRFEADEEEIRVYRRYYYICQKQRVYERTPANYLYQGYPDSCIDSYQWSKTWPDLAGTEYTIEMMIMPYSKEDLEDVV